MAKFSMHRALNNFKVSGNVVLNTDELRSLNIKDKFDVIIKSVDKCCDTTNSSSLQNLENKYNTVIGERNEAIAKGIKLNKELTKINTQLEQLNCVNEKLVNRNNKLETKNQIYKIVILLGVAIGIASIIFCF